MSPSRNPGPRGVHEAWRMSFPTTSSRVGMGVVSQWELGRLRDHSCVGGCPHSRSGAAPAGRPTRPVGPPLSSIGSKPTRVGHDRHPCRKRILKNMATKHVPRNPSGVSSGAAQSCWKPGASREQRLSPAAHGISWPLRALEPVLQPACLTEPHSHLPLVYTRLR